MERSNNGADSRPGRTSETSYKFQRLREKLRGAIASGELAGKLPGERALAKRFHVNAKTLSKALTDLAAEGVLDRSIGRGTYVKGTAPATAAGGRWLLLCDTDDADAPILLDYLRRTNPDTQVASSVSDLRPSYLNAFTAVIDAASATPESFLRDLVVRNLTVVAIGREARMYSMHAVVADVALGAARVGRDLMFAGHRRFAAVEAAGSNVLTQSLRHTASRLAPDATVDTYSPEDAGRLRYLDASAAIVCDSAATARKVRAALATPVESAGMPGLANATPARRPGAALAAVGIAWADAPCSGYFVDGATIAEQVVSLLREPPAGRPATLWMAGDLVDRGTTMDATIQHESEANLAVTGGVLV
jgi:hypothetical protein